MAARSSYFIIDNLFHLCRNYCFKFHKKLITIIMEPPRKKLCLLENMDSQVVENLIKRLEKTESQIKLLTSEVSDIKCELLKVQKNTFSTESCFSSTTTKTDTRDYSGNANNDKIEFIKEGDFVVVYTDGACENNGQRNAKAGIGVWFDHGHSLNLSQPVDGRATNNTAEIQACVEAIKLAYKNGIRKILIRTDSAFVINSMTKWIRNWKKNNWKSARGAEVINKNDFIILDKALNLMDKVKWEHVQGHKGVVGNEEADKLARAGAVLYKKPNKVCRGTI